MTVVLVLNKVTKILFTSQLQANKLAVCSKTCEREIATYLYECIDSNRIFNDNQFDFRRGRTVDDQFLLTYGMVLKWYDVGFIVDVVLFDNA